MKLRSLHVPLLALIVLSLPTLAFLQYRWLGELGEFEQRRMRSGLDLAVERFHDTLDDDVLERSVHVFHLDRRSRYADVEEELAEAHARWRESADFPDVLASIHWVCRTGDEVLLRRFDEATGSLVTEDTPPASWSKSLVDRLQEAPDCVTGELPARDPIVLDMDDRTPAFLILQDEIRPRALSILTLDHDAVIEDLLGESLRRHLAAGETLDFEVLVTRIEDGETIFRSAADLQPGDLDAPDAQRQIFGVRRPRWIDRGDEYGDIEHRWLLSVRHEAGSLDAAVDRQRYRNLAVSFGVLLLLGGSIATLVASTRQARLLAEQRFSFVTGVSHELRTPLASISSLSENLADGVVQGSPQVREYGRTIHGQTRRLREMVEGVLAFSLLESSPGALRRRPVHPGVLLEKAVDSVLQAHADAPDVRVSVPDGLPSLAADEATLRTALRNVLGNAVKYGGTGPVEATVEIADDDGPAVRFVITDRGIGIPEEELSRVWEPFFRGRAARDDQVEGSGLGLALVRRIVEAHGGRVEISSAPGKGTRVTLLVPVEGAGQATAADATAGAEPGTRTDPAAGVGQAAGPEPATGSDRPADEPAR